MMTKLVILAAVLLLSAAPADTQLDRALAKLARGEPAAAGELIAIGPQALASIEPYLRDPKVEVRRGAVLAIAGMGGRGESCRLLEGLLRDNEPEIRGRATLAVYQGCARNQRPCPAIVAILEKPHAPATAILMAGDCPDARSLLQRLPEKDRVKWEPAGPVVQANLVAAVALLKLGDASQAKVLASSVRNETANAELLVAVLPEIPNQHLRSLVPLLSDERTTTRFSNAPAGARPPRRIQDAATDAFAKRLGVQLPFAEKPSGKYSAAELQGARAAIEQALSKPVN